MSTCRYIYCLSVHCRAIDDDSNIRIGNPFGCESSFTACAERLRKLDELFGPLSWSLLVYDCSRKFVLSVKRTDFCVKRLSRIIPNVREL